MSGLHLYLFGAPRLESDGKNLAVNRRKGLAILAYLALRGQPQSREALATLFWPDYDQSSALANLRRELSRLRSGLDADLVVADRRQAELAPESDLWVDVKQYQRLLAQAAGHDNHFPAEECPACLAALQEAVGVYTERFLAGFNLPDCPEFDDWQFFEAEGLSQSLAEALQKLIQWHGQAGEHEEAIRYGRRWLALDPLHEPAHRELMTIYARAGQQAAAVRQYEECARILEEELGIEPEPETAELYEAIRLRRFPLERPAPPSAKPQPPAEKAAVPAAPEERYVVEERLAVGGQGEVYLGRDTATGEQVIVKRLRPELVADSERVARFLREGEALRRLEHPNIVHMLDAFEANGQYSIVMEYVPGGTLRELLEREAPLPVEKVLALALELADALARAHHLGIIHRDLKPGNVLLTAGGSPRLTDFGTVRLEREDVRLTRTGALVGSPAYMSPEALRGDRLDPRSDVWSFGVLLYEMLTGQRPFAGETLTQVLVQILSEPAPPLAGRRADVPLALVTLVEQMLAKDPAARPGSMRQVAAALDAIQAGRWPRGLEPVRAPATSLAAPTAQVKAQEIRFCRAADGVQIAYATVGEGPPLVKAANYLTHLEHDWNGPVWRHWLRGLSAHHTLVRYDERGSGLSDWDVADFSMDAWVRDLEAVVDSLGLQRFPLLGISQGASVSVAYAVKHPERVTHLILYGGYARGRYHRDLTPEDRLQADTMINAIRVGWGKENPAFRQLFTTMLMPGGSEAQKEWLNELARISATPENAATMEHAFYQIEVSELARQVTAPTLVLHPHQDASIPFAEGRLLASLIPGAQFVGLDSKNHILLEHEPAWAQFLAAVTEFLDATPQPPTRYWPGAFLPGAARERPPQPPAPPATASRALQQQIRFCQARDGTQIAYATVGKGPALVKVANWLSHLEYEWKSPVWNHWLTGLAQRHTLLRYDMRGCGLSSWEPEDFSFESRVTDLEAVVQAAGLERFPLLALSGGGATAVAYAALHPEKVSHLIVCGSYARGRRNRENKGLDEQEAEMFLSLMRLGWGRDNPAFRQVYTSLFIPEGTPEQYQWFNDLQRMTATPENAARIYDTSSRVDVRELATRVQAPTLVVHARDDQLVTFREGKELATLIPNAQFVSLDSRNHILLEHEPAWAQFLAVVHDFLETPDAPLAPRQWPGVALAQAASERLFVGRQEELGWLQAQLDAVLGGEGRIAFITGEAGQGKSSLVQAFVRQAQARDPELVALTGNCNAYTGQGDPYLPFREILQALAGVGSTESAPGESNPAVRAALPAVVRALVEVAPDLLDIFVPTASLLPRARGQAPAQTVHALESLAAVGPTAEGVRLQQTALFAQVAALLEAVAREHPLILFIDDLQWVDQGSANLLLHLGKRLGNSRILLAGAYRPADVAIVTEGGRHPLQQVVNEMRRDRGDVVRDLGAAEGRAFVDALLDSQPNQLDEPFRQTLYRQTQGHPLFTLELLRGMQERGDLLRDEAGRWVAQASLDWETLPARVEGAIGERISRLARELQALLQAASVIGEVFSAELLAQVTGREPADLARLLSQELDRMHRLVQTTGIRREGAVRLSTYRFRHILIQRYLYQELDESERAYQHEAVAEALEALHGDQAAELAAPALAHHFSAAAQPQRAASYWRHVGDQAWRSAAIAEATRYYRRALDAWPAGDDAGRAGILRQLGSCAWLSSQLDEGLRHMQRATELYAQLEDRQGAGATQRALGRLYWEQGDRARARQHYQQALELLQLGPESVELARAYSSISQLHMLAWENEEALLWGERALELARRLDAPDVLSHALNNVGSATAWKGEPERAIALLSESKALALKYRLPHDACRAYYNLGSVFLDLDRYEEALTEFEGMLEVAIRFSSPLFAGSALVEAAQVEWKLGRWRKALARRGGVAEWLRQSQSLGYLEILSTLFEARVANDLGQPEEALDLLDRLSTHVKQTDEAQQQVPYLHQRLRANVALGRGEEASADVEAMLALAISGHAIHPENVLPLYEAIVWLATQGNREDARRFLAHLVEIAERYSSMAAVKARQEAEGTMALYQGALGDAEEALREAATGWRRLGRPADEARALLALARTQQAAGQREQAGQSLLQILALLDRLGEQLDDEPLRQSFRYGPLAQGVRQIQTLLQIAEGGLPAQATPFVGRERELSELRQLLWQPAPRLVTIVGPGGIGKTRLATEVAAASAMRFRDDLLFVPLASLTGADQIVPAMVQTLGVQFREAGNEREQLLRYLATRQQLLVLDNFEHLLDGVSLVEELLARAPDVTILVTSREPLNLSSETVYRLSGLPYPQAPLTEGVQSADYGAVALLLQQIARHRPGFSPLPAELQQVVRICQLVQGMPLALLLAASWIELLTLEEIGDEIAGSLDLLEGELRDLPARQQSIRAVFYSSWRMLDEETQTAMGRLSVFRGHFSRQAAQAVGGCTLRVLLALVNKSWLQRGDDGFQVHELVRQFAAEQLRKMAGGEEDARNAHAAYYVAFLRDQHRLMSGPQQQEAFQAVRAVFDQAAAAWRWLVERDGSTGGTGAGLRVIVEQMLPALYRYVESLQRGVALFPLLELALSQPAVAEGDLALHTILLVAKTAFYRTGLPIRFEALGSVVPYDDQLEEAWQLAEQQPLPAFWRIVLWYGYGRNYARDEAIALLRPLLETLRAEGARWELAFGLHHLVLLNQLQPEDEATRIEIPAHLDEALGIFQKLGDRREQGYVLRSWGQMYRLREEMPEAISCWQEAMVHLGEAGDWIMAALLNWHVGDAYLQMGNLDAAFAYYRTMSEIGLAHGDSSLVGDMVGKESYEAARYGQLDRALETKWLALSYAGPRGDWYTEAWTTWEMGELQRLRGELDEAITWFERALLLFNRIDSRSGDAFYHRGLGDVAASRGFHAVAAFHFEESLRYAEEDRHPWARAYALIGLARANLALGSLTLAQEQMARALDTARATGDRAITLAALAGAAEYLAACGRTGLAAEVAAAVAANPISWTETRTRAANVLAPTPLPESTPAAGSPASDVWALAAMASSQLAPPGEERADVAAPQDVSQRSALS